MILLTKIICVQHTSQIDVPNPTDARHIGTRTLNVFTEEYLFLWSYDDRNYFYCYVIAFIKRQER